MLPAARVPVSTSQPDRGEHTIGVAGCGQRQTCLVVCTDGAGCVALAGRRVD